MTTPTGRGATDLTGGGAGALDAIDGNDLNDKDRTFVVKAYESYVYELDADSGEGESGVEIIAPDTNAGTKRHKRCHPYNCPKISLNGSDYVAATFRSNIGLGTIATQAYDSVNIDGGDIAAAVNIHHSTGDIDLSTVTANGDILVVDGFTPVNSVPRVVGGVTTLTTQLTSVLAGIDDQLVNVGGGQAPQSVAFSIYGGSGIDGDHTVTGTEVLTENKQYGTLTIPNGTTLVYGLGCDVVAARKIVGGATGKINSIGVDGSTTTGGVNAYVPGTDGDGADSMTSNPGAGLPGNNGSYLGAGGGGGGYSTTDGGAGGDAGGAGGAGGVAGNGSVGTAMPVPTSWADCIGAVGGGGGAGGSNTGGGWTGYAGGSGAKFCCLEIVEAELASGFQINSYGGAGAGTGGSSLCGGGGGGGGGVWFRYQIGTLLLHSVNVNGGAGANTSTLTDGGSGGLGLYREEHVTTSSAYGTLIAHYDFAVDGGATCTLSQEIPDNAVVTYAVMEVITEFDSAADGASIALGFEATNDVLTATAEASYSVGFHDLIQDGTAAHFIKIDGAKGLTLTITGENLTSGKAYFLINYGVTE